VGLADNDMIPIYVSIAQTLTDLKKYDEAIAYFMKELDLRHGEHQQVAKKHLMFFMLFISDLLFICLDVIISAFLFYEWTLIVLYFYGY